MMATTRPLTTGATRRPSAHTRPLDLLLTVLDEAHGTTCRALLWVLKRHLEKDVPAFDIRRAGRW